MRIIVASRPAMMKNTRPTAKYMMPRRLWSTVITQSCRRSITEGRVTPARTPVSVWSTAAIALLERAQVGDHLGDLLGVELHRRHQRARLDLVGVGDPGAQLGRRVRRRAG